MAKVQEVEIVGWLSRLERVARDSAVTRASFLAGLDDRHPDTGKYFIEPEGQTREEARAELAKGRRSDLALHKRCRALRLRILRTGLRQTFRPHEGMTYAEALDALEALLSPGAELPREIEFHDVAFGALDVVETRVSGEDEDPPPEHGRPVDERLSVRAAPVNPARPRGPNGAAGGHRSAR